MEKHIIDSVSSYLKLLEELGIENYVYRGQGEHHPNIQASGFRGYKYSFAYDTMINIDEIISDFHKSIIAKISPKEEQHFIAFSQHYGIPTNLVDFSLSPLVSLFFACSSKSEPQINITKYLKDTELINLENDIELQKTFIHNMLKDIKKNYSDTATVYLVEKKWLLDISDIVLKLGNKNLFEEIMNGENNKIENSISYEFNQLLRDFFKTLNDSDRMQVISDLIKTYKKICDINVDIEVLYNKYHSIINIWSDINEHNFKENIYRLDKILNSFAFNEDISYYDQPNFHHKSEDVMMRIYIDILRDILYFAELGDHIILKSKIQFVYTPANIFNRIEFQQGLFVYQPYLYVKESTYGRNVLSYQTIEPDIMIEVKNYKEILQELSILNINIGTLYGDTDSIARNILDRHKRKLYQ